MKFTPVMVSTFRVVWRVAGDPQSVDHLVVARNADDARRISSAALRRAVRAEFRRWKIDDVI